MNWFKKKIQKIKEPEFWEKKAEYIRAVRKWYDNNYEFGEDLGSGNLFVPMDSMGGRHIYIAYVPNLKDTHFFQIEDTVKMTNIIETWYKNGKPDIEWKKSKDK